ncbi:MAG: HypD family hydrogenase formation protein, partial [Endomicrobiales bacterium]
MKLNTASIHLMEVCGTHTMSIARNGLKKLFPPETAMLSGPGCPVCVTPTGDIDRAVALGREPGIIITTFGDMLRVPGSRSSLEKERSEGADVRILYSPVDALDIALKNPAKEVVFLGVGFETTSPTVAATVLIALK